MGFLSDLLRKANIEEEEGETMAEDVRLVRVDFLIDLLRKSTQRERMRRLRLTRRGWPE